MTDEKRGQGQVRTDSERCIAMTEMQVTSSASPSPGSVRAKRYRERMKTGKIFVRIEMTPEGVGRLVEQGWLDPEKRIDPAAVTSAFLKLGVAALWPEKRRA